MRDATIEEKEHIQKHIDAISIETGVNFWDIQEKLKGYDKTIKFIEKAIANEEIK